MNLFSYEKEKQRDTETESSVARSQSAEFTYISEIKRESVQSSYPAEGIKHSHAKSKFLEDEFIKEH